MRKFLLDDLFPAPITPKPRERRQTWLKDPGFDGIRWGGELGLAELPDYLEVVAPYVDYVKLFPAQAITSPHDWFMRKTALYSRSGVIPYFDHGYFQMAYRANKLEAAIVAARELGVEAMEFMNLPLSAARLGELARFAAANDMKVIYEFHPPSTIDRSLPERPATVDEILQAAASTLDAGAVKLMLDHKEFDIQGAGAEEEYGKIMERLGLDMLVFEAESPKFKEHVEHYFRSFGSDINLANIMPGQVLTAVQMRQDATVR